jgi:phosphoribosylanthranilate isomerase
VTASVGPFVVDPSRSLRPTGGRVRVKVCGVTRPEDAVAAEALGVDAVGVIFAAVSRRRLTLRQAADVVAPLGPFVTRVGVFVEPSLDEVEAAVERLRLQVVQLHGRVEPALVATVRRSVAVVRSVAWREGLDVDELASWPVDGILIDGPEAGSGEPFDWEGAGALARLPRWTLAGGLDPGNVAGAVLRLRPAAVDVASGVESAPGIKDVAKMAAFIAAVRGVERVPPPPAAER